MSPASVDRELADSAFRLAALTGDQAFYDKLLATLKNAKSPEEYYMYSVRSCPNSAIRNCCSGPWTMPFLQRFVRRTHCDWSASVMQNPAGEKLAWDFVLTHWNAVQKVGGPFASAEIVGATSSFCDARMRDQVADFFAAHKIEAAERTYRQSIERINDCVDLKSQQEPQLASWLGQHGSSAGGQ